MFWCPVPVQFLTRWPYQGYGPLSTDGELLVSSLALMQMWEPDEMPCVPKYILGAAWTKKTLDACSRGFRTIRNQDMVPLESIQKQWLCHVYIGSQTSLGWVVIHICVCWWWQISMSYSSVIKFNCFRSVLFDRFGGQEECFVFCITMIYIHMDLWELWFIWKYVL